MANTKTAPTLRDADVGLGQALVKGGLLTQRELHTTLEWLRAQSLPPERLGHTLVEFGFVSERELTEALSRQLGLPAIPFGLMEAEEDAVKALPPDLALRYRVVPLRLTDGGLSVAVTARLDDEAIAEVSRAAGDRRISLYLASESEVESALSKFYEARPAADEPPPSIIDETTDEIDDQIPDETHETELAEASEASERSEASESMRINGITKETTPAVSLAEMRARVPRYIAETREFADALEQLVHENERMSVELDALRSEEQRLREESVRLRSALDRELEEKRTLLSALSRFAEETLTRFHARA